MGKKKKLEDYMACIGCECELYNAYDFQEDGYDVGLEFEEDHISFFALDKDGKFVVELFYNETE